MDLEEVYKDISKKVKGMSKEDIDKLNEELKKANKKPHNLEV